MRIESDMDEAYSPISLDSINSTDEETEGEVCFGCGAVITDRYLLKVSGRAWHVSCLRCCVCETVLDRQTSCFIRGDSIYCKTDYDREFATKCSKCTRNIQATDWVRRARDNVYHLACFACDSCKRQLSTGEEFALQDDRVLCKTHYVESIEGGSNSDDTSSQKQKAKRVRTTFSEEQLQVLQANFQLDSNPDGQDLERIAQITGLSKRVTQVWFQNSRARQKKHQANHKPGEGPHQGDVDGMNGMSSSGRPQQHNMNELNNMNSLNAMNNMNAGLSINGSMCSSINSYCRSPNSEGGELGADGCESPITPNHPEPIPNFASATAEDDHLHHLHHQGARHFDMDVHPPQSMHHQVLSSSPPSINSSGTFSSPELSDRLHQRLELMTPSMDSLHHHHLNDHMMLGPLGSFHSMMSGVHPVKPEPVS